MKWRRRDDSVVTVRPCHINTGFGVDVWIDEERNAYDAQGRFASDKRPCKWDLVQCLEEPVSESSEDTNS